MKNMQDPEGIWDCQPWEYRQRPVVILPWRRGVSDE